MESSHYTNTDPTSSENKSKKDGKKTTPIIDRGDVPARFQYEQRTVPRPQREAMGRALLEGVMFERPRAEGEAEGSEAKDKEKKKTEATAPQTAERPATESFDELMQRSGFGPEFTAATTKENAEPPIEPAITPPTPRADHPAWRRPPIIPPLEHQVAQAPTMEQSPLTPPEHQQFNEIAEQAQLGGVSEQAIAEAAAAMPVSAFEQPRSEDEIFGEQVSGDWPEATPPEHPRFYEQHDAPPFDAGGGTPPGPPSPPTLEGGAFGDGPERSSHPNEAAINALAPAGNVLGPNGPAGFTAIEAQRRIDNLRHRSAETGLAAGVMFLGVMLALEHGGRKRGDRKLQKQITTQQKHIKTMGQQLQQERTAHSNTVANLNQVRANQVQATERLNQVAQQTQGGERLGMAAAPAPARSAEQAPRPQQPMPERPGMPGQQTQAEQQAAVEQEPTAPQLRPGERMAKSEWHSIVVNEKGQAVEDAIAYGQGFRQEQQQEQIRDRMADNGLSAGKAGGSTHGAMQGGGFYQGMAPLPQYTASPLQQSLPSGMTTPGLPAGPPLREDPQHLLPQPKHQAVLKSPWTWLLFALLMFAFFAASFLG